MPNKQKRPEYDPKIMDELLNKPTVKEKVAQMSPDEIEMFKSLLVSQGTYARYVLERNKEAFKQSVRTAFKRK